MATVLGLASVGGWLAWPGGARPDSDQVAAHDIQPTQAEAPPAAGVASAPRALPALPPEDAPLSGILRPLRARADAGDRKAACRLALELLRCERIAEWQLQVKPAESLYDASSRANTDPALAAYRDRQSEWIRRRLEQCQAVPDDMRSRGTHYLAQAALAGEPEAMVRYAEGHHWPLLGQGMLAGPAFDRWRRDVPGMVERALRAGDPRAAYLLQMAYFDDFGLHSALVPDDPEQALVMHVLVSRLYGTSELPVFRDRVDASTLVRARARAEQLHRDHFDGRRLRGTPFVTALHSLPAEGQPPTPFCQDP